MADRSVEDYIIDFSKEESGGGGGNIRVKPGTYKVKIVAAKAVKSEQKKTLGLELTLAFLEGNLRKQKKKIKDTLWVAPKAYRRFRQLLEAVDEDVPGKIKLGKIAGQVKGKDLYVEIDDEPGREGYGPRSRVQFDGFINEEDYDPEADDDELDEDEEDEVEEGEEEDLDDEDEDEEEDEEDEEEEEEEEEPAPKKRRKRAPARKAPAKSKAKKKKAADDDEDEEIDELDLDSY